MLIWLSVNIKYLIALYSKREPTSLLFASKAIYSMPKAFLTFPTTPKDFTSCLNLWLEETNKQAKTTVFLFGQ